MKIALVTIHNTNNYGAVLQAFALQQVLSRYGDVEIINYDNRHISIGFDLIRVKLSIHGLLGIGKDICRLLPRYRVIREFKKFIQENLKITKSFSAQELERGMADGFDVYVAGSDQIWNPACISENCIIDPIYFLSFAPRWAKKLSYASSMGSYQFSSTEKNHIKNLLTDFDAVSVREKDAQVLLQEVLEKTVQHVFDPTLLLSKKEWLEAVGVSVEDLSNNKEKYILLYTVPKVPLIRSAVDYFSKKLGLKVVSIDQGLSAGAKVDQQIRDAGPVDFLRLFANAEFVITDSFHGTCFSVNFGKPFIVISSGKHANRIESLLSLLGLQERIIKSEEEIAKVDIMFDFRDAREKLFAEREQALFFLNRSFI